MDRWDVYYLQGNLSIRHAIGALLDQAANLLVLSATLAENLGAAEDLISAVRNEKSLRSMKIMVGGQALHGVPTLWQELGADGTATDAVAAVAEADWLVGVLNAEGRPGSKSPPWKPVVVWCSSLKNETSGQRIFAAAAASSQRFALLLGAAQPRGQPLMLPRTRSASACELVSSRRARTLFHLWAKLPGSCAGRCRKSESKALRLRR